MPVSGIGAAAPKLRVVSIDATVSPAEFRRCDPHPNRIDDDAGGRRRIERGARDREHDLSLRAAAVRPDSNDVDVGAHRQFVSEMPTVRLQADLDTPSSRRPLGELNLLGTRFPFRQHLRIDRAQLGSRVEELLRCLRRPPRAICRQRRPLVQHAAHVALAGVLRGSAETDDVEE